VYPVNIYEIQFIFEASELSIKIFQKVNINFKKIKNSVKQILF